MLLATAVPIKIPLLEYRLVGVVVLSSSLESKGPYACILLLNFVENMIVIYIEQRLII